jgi:hypothetical protein
MAWKGLALQFIFRVFDAGVEVNYQSGFPISYALYAHFLESILTGTTIIKQQDYFI